MKYIIAMLLVVSGIANAGQVSVSTVGVAHITTFDPRLSGVAEDRWAFLCANH